MRKVLPAVFALCLSASALGAQGNTGNKSAASEADSCKSAGLKAPTKWIGWSIGEVELRTGPGTSYPVHESGDLLDGERIQVLKECNGWVEGRVMPIRMIDGVVREHGLQKAQRMLLFWAPRQSIRRQQD
jgi:hypothetical protein